MTVIIRKTDTPLQIKRKMKRAAAAAARQARKTKGFPAHKFVGKLKGLYGNSLEYQKRVRDEWSFRIPYPMPDETLSLGNMKSTILIHSDSKEKIELLIRVAKEMGITVETVPPVDEVTVVSEPSLAETWNSKEDERWDKLYGKKK